MSSPVRQTVITCDAVTRPRTDAVSSARTRPLFLRDRYAIFPKTRTMRRRPQNRAPPPPMCRCFREDRGGRLQPSARDANRRAVVGAGHMAGDREQRGRDAFLAEIARRIGHRMMTGQPRRKSVRASGSRSLRCRFPVRRLRPRRNLRPNLLDSEALAFQQRTDERGPQPLRCRVAPGSYRYRCSGLIRSMTIRPPGCRTVPLSTTFIPVGEVDHECFRHSQANCTARTNH